MYCADQQWADLALLLIRVNLLRSEVCDFSRAASELVPLATE